MSRYTWYLRKGFVHRVCRITKGLNRRQSKKPAGQINVASANQIAPSTLHPTLHQSKKHIIFWGQFRRIQPQHSTHSNTQHTHARSRRTCRRPDDWAAHLLHTSVRHVIVIHEGGWSTQELSYTEQDPRGKNWAQRTASAAAQQTSQPAATPGDRWDPRVGSEGFHYIR